MNYAVLLKSFPLVLMASLMMWNDVVATGNDIQDVALEVEELIKELSLLDERQRQDAADAAVAGTAGNFERVRRCEEAGKSVPNACSYDIINKECADMCLTWTNDDLHCGIKGSRHGHNQPISDEETIAKRIIGGKPAEAQEWPWHVSLEVFERNDTTKNRQWCAGAILAEDLILTAAHCIDPYTSTNASQWRAVVGEHHLELHDVGQKSYRVKKFIKHENYLSRSFNTEAKGDVYISEYDVALFVLEDKIDMTQFNSINSICIPNEKVTFEENHLCTIVGWGHQTFGDDDNKPVILMEAQVPLVDRVVCNKPHVYDGNVDQSNICAGYAQGGIDACQFDSGGSMVCTKDGNRWYATGLISSGHECARKHAFGLYTNLPNPAIRNWIVNKMITH